MRAWGNDTVRGGQTVFHGLRMWSQLLTVGVMTIAVLVVTVPAVMLWRTTSTYHGYAAGMLTLAEIKLAIGYQADAGQEVRLENGDTVVATITDIAAHGPWHAARDGVLETVISGAWLGGKIGFGPDHRDARLVPIPGPPAETQEAPARGGTGERARAEPAGAPAEGPSIASTGRGAGALPHRRRALPRADRDPAHDRVRHDRFRQDRPDLGSRATDPPERRPVRDLRQDGELYAKRFSIRSGTFCSIRWTPAPRAGRRSSRPGRPGTSTPWPRRSFRNRGIRWTPSG